VKDLNNIQNIYFVGIGGIGMSALARYFKLLEKNVSGYDKTASALTQAMSKEGIEITFLDEVSEIPAVFQNIEDSLIVYTPAIPKSNQILSYFFTNNYQVVKRANLLGEISKNSKCLAVAGTHGKTTTSAILGHLLMACDMPMTAFLGGIAENYKTNFISNGFEIMVVEADEFDRSFLALHPDIACITSMDADHLDIYGSSSSLEDAFKSFSKLLPNEKCLLFKKGLPLEGQTVAIEEEADFEAQNVRIEDGNYLFDLKTPNEIIKNLVFNLPGNHNLHNAVTALGMAILSGVPTHGLPEALQTFKGVERRFSYKIKRGDLVLIDDYAHHPKEIDALFQAVHVMYPNDKKLIVFQPHLYSRTKDFGESFANSLSKFDEVILLDVYAAREEPIDGITSQWLLDQISIEVKHLVSKTELPFVVKQSKCRIKLIVGAGDIGAEVHRITKILSDES